MTATGGVLVGFCHEKWNEGIQYAKHHGVGADGEGQRQDGGYGETGRTAQQAERQTHVGPDRLEGRPLPHFRLRSSITT